MTDLAHLLLQNALETRQEIGRLVSIADAGRREAEIGRAAINQRIDDFRGVVTSRLDRLEQHKGNTAKDKGPTSWLSHAPALIQLLTFAGTIAAGVFLHLTAGEWKTILFKLPPG